MIYPGPRSIAPGSNPGGVVIHIYEVPTQRLLVVTHAVSPEAVFYQAGEDALRAMALAGPDVEGYCLVAFDGDSGERFAAEDWMT